MSDLPVRLLSCVSPEVASQVGRAREYFTTISTNKDRNYIKITISQPFPFPIDFHNKMMTSAKAKAVFTCRCSALSLYAAVSPEVQRAGLGSQTWREQNAAGRLYRALGSRTFPVSPPCFRSLTSEETQETGDGESLNQAKKTKKKKKSTNRPKK